MHVGIFGSCVTRDAFGDLLPETLIAGYVARSTVASAFGPAADIELPLDWLEGASPWEMRMVEQDLSKTGLALLAGANLDMLIVDLIDERFDVLVGNGIVTDSASLRKSSAADLLLSQGTAFSLLSEGRDRLWRQTLPMLLDWLRALDIPIVLHEATFSTKYRNASDGAIDLIPQSEAWTTRINVRLRAMYADIAEGLGQRVHRLVPPDDVVLADDSHKWGLAPFHYIPDYYDWVFRGITALLASPEHNVPG